jgi:hypothetical protein
MVGVGLGHGYLPAQAPEFGRLRRDLRHHGVRSWLVHAFPRWTVFYGIQGEYLVLYRIEGGQTNLRRLVIG